MLSEIVLALVATKSIVPELKIAPPPSDHAVEFVLDVKVESKIANPPLSA